MVCFFGVVGFGELDVLVFFVNEVIGVVDFVCVFVYGYFIVFLVGDVYDFGVVCCGFDDFCDFVGC